MIEEPPKGPMELVYCDCFHFGGKEFLLTVDEFSSFVWVSRFSGSPTSASIIRSWTEIFRGFGFPKRLWSDGAPVFNSREVREWARRAEIQLELSSAYHPQSNGHSERNIGMIKKLMEKVSFQKENLEEALAFFNATPRSSVGVSPSRMLLGRHPRVPGLLGVRDNKDPTKCGEAHWLKNKDKEGRNGRVVLN